MGDLTIVGVFVAGFVSFLSPCVIPLIPMYVGFLAGDVTGEEGGDKKRLFINAFAFLFGLLLVFTLLGAGASWLGQVLFANTKTLTKIAGAFIFFFGVFQTGLFTPSFLKKEFRFRVKGRAGSAGSAFLLGVAFSFGWSPCVGTILGSIIALASTTGSMYQGIMLLIVYSIGFSVPFLLSVFLISPLMKLIENSSGTLKWIKITTGVIMMALGVLIYTNRINAIIGWFS